MAEALGLAASVIAVLQITSSVISVCYDYSAAARGASWELPKVTTELEALRNVLQTLEPLAKQAEFADPAAGTRLPTLALLCGPKGPLQDCFNQVKRLEEKLKSPSWSDGFGPKRKALVQALRWPLKETETRKTLETISRFKDTLSLAITTDETTLALAIHNLSISTNNIALDTQENVRSTKDAALEMQKDVQSTKSVALDMQLNMQREAIYHWLSAPDPSINHNRACRSRQATTGSWFLNSDTFSRWKKQSSLLWLHGKAGCGKTILSSTIIAEVLQKHHLQKAVAVAYFYFDFNDVEKQKSNNMIRSLIIQLSGQSTKELQKLRSLFSSCDNGKRQPDAESLMTALKEIVERFDKIYIILDALDECSDRNELLENIQEIQEWKLQQIHLLLTSRRLTDIEDSLEPLTNPRDRVCIQSAVVDVDIRTYVHERLQSDRALKRWRDKPQVQEEIKTTLMKKADGMFRWAVCQLDVLRDCLNLSTLRKALKSLPKTLDETYARMLCEIAEEHCQDAIKLLQWLTYSARPLRIEELAEIVAVNIEGPPWFNCDMRFPEQQEILLICSSLVTTDALIDGGDDDNTADYSSEEDDTDTEDYLSEVGSDKRSQIVRLAHFSVKEYLVSQRIQDQASAKYAIREISANQSIAATCLAYLLQLGQYNPLTSETIVEFPLARYAAEYWTQHAGTVGKDLGPIERLGLELCLVDKQAYINSYQLYDPHMRRAPVVDRYLSNLAPPLYYVAFTGVTEMVQLMLERGADVNAQGEEFGNALQAASYRGHEAVVRLLLEQGADINAQSGYYGSALQAASFRGHEAVVQLLLKQGADVNAQGGGFGSALQAASYAGSKAVVRLLLKQGADVNAQSKYYGNALQAASLSGNEAVVQLLLEQGADINAQCGQHGSALQAAAASNRGFEAVVRLLLKQGADVNAQSGYNGNALQAASYAGCKAVVQLLLEQGADTNAQSVQYGSALQAASNQGHEAVVQLLLEQGADVNAQGEEFDSALQAASYRGSEAVMQMLLKQGADVNAQGGYCGNALQAASYGGHEAVVQLLLEKGADINTHGGKYDNALQAASYMGHKTVVRLLLKKIADVNAQGGGFGSALQAASYRGHEVVVQLLLEQGADVNIKGGRYGSALQAALECPLKYRGAVVQLLLDAGAEEQDSAATTISR